MAKSKRRQSNRLNALVFVESLLIAYVCYIANFLLTNLQVTAKPSSDTLVVNILIITVTALICGLSVGLYESKLRETFRGIVRRLFVSLGLTCLLVFIISGFLFTDSAMPAIYIPLCIALNLISLVLFRYFIDRIGIVGMGKTRILVLGAGTRASIIETRMRRDVDRIAFELVGFVPIAGDDRENGIKNERIIHAKIDDSFRQFLIDNDIEELVIACDQRRGTLPVSILFDCRLKGIEVTDLLDFMEREIGQIVVELMYPSWVIYSKGFHSQHSIRESLDNVLNISLSMIILFFTWPIMLVTSLIIYLDDGRRTGASVFYKQERVGKDGKLFNILKFRSMRPDAEKDGAKWASKDDNRVTSIGNFIRKYRIDELPQLFNVLKGEMSFVGPRPERPQFVQQLVKEVPYYNQRHNVKPGLAGWAQLNYPYGASVKDSLEKLKFDLFYVKHQSLLLDILILIRTVEIVLFGKGR
ncbi:TIGR03013 family XrtA/PEP-CTERM system glycosyltransferase [Glaciecola sp. KUL10]|uniref:TIGR03013 family XrtA/PEP-CTERM system glycosyltransferase n=1 Tax=Glaciecola sp. (strain KUL10) TaxID=2161813 RepID=UPI000D783682|nr:TIGR03013 family XrtA/PEP-CTERM system glycosyltransferase [Glaciecola sp. KUL10]GBL04256.1 sugar transferase [Glaciecola sp. KUL10]